MNIENLVLQLIMIYSQENGKISLLGLKQIWVFESRKNSYFRALKFGI